MSLPARSALFTAAGKFVHGGPSPGLCSLYTDAYFLVAGLDVCRLPFLFVGVAGFVALRHGVSLTMRSLLCVGYGV